MIFTPGDFITLGLVLAILFLFRQLDRNNRSLEKLRKYSDHMKADLGDYVAEREVELKNYGVELGVQQQAAQQLLKHIKEVDSQLAERAENIATIGQRIGEYDRALDELMRLTGKTKADIEQIRETGAFTESLSRRLKEGREQLLVLERDMVELRERLLEENRQALEETGGEVLAEIKSRIEDVRIGADDIERRVENYREALVASEADRDARIEADRAEINKMLAESLSAAATRVGSFEAETQDRLRLAADERISRFQEALDTKLGAYQNQTKARLAEVQGDIKARQEAWQEAWDDFEMRQKAQREDLEEQLAAMQTKTAAMVEALEQEAGQLIEDTRDKTRMTIEELENRSAPLIATIEEKMDGLQEQFNRMERAILDRTGALESTVSNVEADFHRRLEGLGALVDSASDKVLTETADRVDARMGSLETALSTDLADRQKALSSAIAEQHETLARDMARYQNALSSELDGYKDSLSKDLASFQTTITTDFSSYKETFSGDLASQESAFESRVASLEAEQEKLFPAVKERLDELRADFEAALEACTKELSSKRAIFERDTEELARRLVDFRTDFSARMDDAIASAEKSGMQAVDARLGTFQELANERFERLAGFDREVDKLEKVLMVALAATEKRVQDAFEAFVEESGQFRSEEADKFGSALQALRGDLSSVEGELNLLKEKAYDNVSEKLKVFEDDFFTDLARRGQTIEEELEAWTRRYDQKIEELGASGIEERAAMEQRVGDELKGQLAKLGERVSLGLSSLEDRTAAIEESAKGELARLDSSLESWRQQLASILEDAKAQADSGIKAELANHRLSVSELIKQDERRIEEELSMLVAQIEDRKQELATLSDEQSKEIAGWRSRIATQVREADEELARLSDRIRDERNQSEEALARIRGELERVREEGQAKADDLASRGEDRLQGLEEAVRESERRIAEFVEQTALFSRADELVTTLERKMEDLRADIERLEQHRSEAAELETQFVKIKRLEDEVNQKMTRFLSEQQRIKVMEADFDRLIRTSQAVDTKLAQVTSADDTLQSLQAQLRRLEAAVGDAEEKYQRIERKNEILDATADGVDRNFEALQSAESQAKAFADKLSRLEDDFTAVSNLVHQLSVEKERSDVVMDRVSTLDATLRDLEDRIASMQKAREWLARTETRLGEIAKQAQEQVTVMEALLKSPGASGALSASRDDRGAPPPGQRDTVISLARQGWKVDAIAKALNLSRGEVELILDLSNGA